MISYKIVAMLVVSSVLANAGTIAFQGAPTGVYDGTHYDLPYEVTIDGTPQLVDCFDIADGVWVGQTWTASLLTLADAASSGFFSSSNDLAQYERVAWLSAQTYSTTDEQIGLQYAIWSVFGTAPQTSAASTYESAADQAAANNYAGFSFSSFMFIQQAGAVSGEAGTEQAFVFNNGSSGTRFTSNTNPVAPEPGTVWMLAGALIIAASVAYRRKLHKLT
jgi:hypothetical protein